MENFRSTITYNEEYGQHHLSVPYWDCEPWPYYDLEELINLFYVLYKYLQIWGEGGGWPYDDYLMEYGADQDVKQKIKEDVLDEIEIKELALVMWLKIRRRVKNKLWRTRNKLRKMVMNLKVKFL